MSTTLYTEQENGNLKLVAEVEDIDNAALAVDALLDNAPRLKDREFVAIVGSLENGQAVRVSVTDDAPVNPRRAMTISFNGSEATVEESAPSRAPRRQPRKQSTRKPAAAKAKSTAKAKPAAKRGTTKRGTASRASAAKKAASKPRVAPKATAKKTGAKKASPFKAKHDDE